MHCPDVTCKVPVAVDELSMLLDQQMLDKFYERTFNLAAELQNDISWCPTPNCKYAFVFEIGETELLCP